MSNPRKADVATEADWSWAEDPDAMRAVERAAQKASIEFDALECDDAVQDASLWLAVHPGLVASYRDREGARNWVDLLAYRIYSHGLRDQAIGEAKRQRVTYSKDKIEEEQGWEL